MYKKKNNQMNINKMKYTVLSTVYERDKVDWLKQSIDSMLQQTIQPSEYLLLVDGPVSSDIRNFLLSYKRKFKQVKVIFFEKNRGLGPTLKDGVEMAKYEYIARMDSDDIAVKDRCEKQLLTFLMNPKLDIVGGNVAEFMEDISHICSYRILPESDPAIKKFARRRNPFNHPSVMFKKNTILKAGNYRERHLCEDYDLWARLIINNAQCYNIQDFLLYMRINENFYKRRGGKKYLSSMLSLKKEFYDMGFYHFKDYFISCISHIMVCLIPNAMRHIIYTKILRK